MRKNIDLNAMIAFAALGYSLTEIKGKFDCSYSNVSQRLNKEGIKFPYSAKGTASKYNKFRAAQFLALNPTWMN